MVIVQVSVSIIVECQLLPDRDISRCIQPNVVTPTTVFCLGYNILTPIIAVVNKSPFVAFIAGIDRRIEFFSVRRVKVIERQIIDCALPQMVNLPTNVFP